MYELTSCIGAAVDADISHLYLVETEGQLVQFPPTEGPGWGGHSLLPTREGTQDIGPGGSVAAFCAHAKDVVGISDISERRSVLHSKCHSNHPGKSNKLWEG